ncbi:MAG: hypothetical protein ABSA94_13425, partial [Acidobacteriaceae bacterium]
GQAPRETLPAGNTKEVDAGATAAAEPQQVASNDTGKEVALTNAEGNVIDSGASTDKKTKTRLSDKMKEPKPKQAQEKASKKKQKFVPPTETPEQLAQDKQDQAALGLNGDTTRKKKVNPAKGGPKRRLGDEDKSTPPAQDGAAGSSTPSGTAPAPSTPQNPPSAQTAPPAQGTTPTQPQL